MGVARFAPQGAHYYYADVIYLPPYLGIKKGAWGSGLHQLGSRPRVNNKCVTPATFAKGARPTCGVLRRHSMGAQE